MSLTRTQRDAMTRAQNGNWELADALEVISRAETRNHGQLVGGTRQGGRLQFLAYGVHNCCQDSCEADTCSCCDGHCEIDDGEIAVITTLNDDVVFSADDPSHDGCTPEWWRGVDITPEEAAEVVAKYAAAVTRPTQQTLIPEPA